MGASEVQAFLTHLALKEHIANIFTVAALLPFLRELQRFDISNHPATSLTCCLPAWPLPELYFHQQADDDLSGHTMLC
jgi:hypothetical protein